LQAGGAQLASQPSMRDVRNHCDRDPPGFGGALADGEVQVLDLVGDAFFECEGMTCASLAAFLAGASLSVISTSLAGTMTATRRPPTAARPVPARRRRH
jgi:hypothetical protein